MGHVTAISSCSAAGLLSRLLQQRKGLWPDYGYVVRPTDTVQHEMRSFFASAPSEMLQWHTCSFKLYVYWLIIVNDVTLEK